MAKRRSNPGQLNASHGQALDSTSKNDPVRAESGAIPLDNPTSSINPHEDFADLMNIDFSQYIADDSDDVASMNTQSSPSIGMMSKTPFKTPAPSEFAEDPIELVSSPAPPPGGPQRLRDLLPGLGSSIEPSFAKDDSQMTRVLERAQAEPEPPVESRLRHSYSLSISSDDEHGGPTNPNALEARRVEPSPPGADENTSGKGKKTTRPQKPDPPKRSGRKKAVVGKGKPTAQQSKAPVASTAKEATPPKRSHLARMLSVLSEPGSLKWEERLVGSRILRSPGLSDEGSPSQSRSPPSGADKVPAAPTAQQDTTPERVDKRGGDSPLTVPASFADPVGLSHSPECEGGENSSPTKPTKNQVSPIIRFGPDGPIDPASPTNAPPSKSETKAGRKRQLSRQKRAQEPQRTVVSPKRRRVHEQAKKRVVRPKAKAKAADAHQEMDDGLTAAVADADEVHHTAVPVLARANSRTQVSETGSPTRANVAGEDTSASGRLWADQLTAVAENGTDIGSPESTTSPTQRPVNLKTVFQAQAARPRAAAAQIDGPHLPGEELLSGGAKTTSADTVTRKSLTGKAIADEQSRRKGHPSHHSQGSPVRQSPPSLEAFRQHVLCQLMSLEARQQDDAPAGSGGPNSPEERGPGRTEPQHMLAGVLHGITEGTLEYVKAKERDLYGIVEEYQSGAAAFLDKVERLHRDEAGAMVGLVKQQRREFIQSCKAGSRACSGFKARLEERPVSEAGPSRLEGWLTQYRRMQTDGGEPINIE